MLSLSRRREMHRWPAMAVLGSAAARHLGRPLAAIDNVELYSCFPSAVRVTQRELELPADGTPSVTGGMAFAGGPLNNFTYQATAAVVGRLRAAPGELGLVTTVSGLLTKAGLMVWSSEPGQEPPLVADLATHVAAATPSVDVVTDHRGPATIASYTVPYDALTPARVIVIADTPDGRRCVAVNDDPALAERGTREELIGFDIHVSGGSFAE
jgi:acetyl-CoA C-acetyltransferase